MLTIRTAANVIQTSFFEVTTVRMFSHNSLVDSDLPQQIKIAEHLARAQDDARQRVLRQRDGQPCLLPDASVQILDHRAAAGQHDAAIGDVGGEFRWSPLQDDAYGIDNNVDAFIQGFADFFVGNDYALGNAFHEVAALDLHRARLVERASGADLDLDHFGRALAD